MASHLRLKCFSRGKFERCVCPARIYIEIQIGRIDKKDWACRVRIKTHLRIFWLTTGFRYPVVNKIMISKPSSSQT